MLKPKSDIANVSAQAVTFSHDSRVLLGRMVSSGVENSFVEVQGEEQVRDVELQMAILFDSSFRHIRRTSLLCHGYINFFEISLVQIRLFRGRRSG